jgi:hypothetical protein
VISYPDKQYSDKNAAPLTGGGARYSSFTGNPLLCVHPGGNQIPPPPLSSNNSTASFLPIQACLPRRTRNTGAYKLYRPRLCQTPERLLHDAPNAPAPQPCHPCRDYFMGLTLSSYLLNWSLVVVYLPSNLCIRRLADPDTPVKAYLPFGYRVSLKRQAFCFKGLTA